ncbi:hypothetical protein [Rossellomorea marisflavi]|uniref:DUF1616 domain-containing protein n=1 Tax=Rossellomorea marisflavi TaxID=189381 RepID=A0A165L665_9BACI|nr:hypothetical protein [Rossellomorea marisflavi]KZE51115.1 hypothetical protein AV649_17275 [Rossellomorea marisflavi]MCM2603267.1 hypothetical protein [Rossellomorea marisflavi]
MKTFVDKGVALVVVSFIGSVLFVSLGPWSEKNVGIVLYYSLFIFPVVLLCMSPGVLLSYGIDHLKVALRKDTLMVSVGLHIGLCLVLLYLPFVIIRTFSFFAIIYFLVLPGVYGLLDYMLKERRQRASGPARKLLGGIG